MPRTARVAPQEHLYHVLTRGNNRQPIFHDEEDFQRYLEIIQKYKERYGFQLYHYALMTNHVHLVIEPSKKGGSLSEIMKGVNLSYAQFYKKKYGHIGHFWQDRYKSIIISKDEYLLACGSYVELNPIRAKMVNDPGEYRWSSYNAYAYGKNDPLLDRHIIYESLSKDERRRLRMYRDFVHGMIKGKEAMKGEMDGKLLYGGNDLEKMIKGVYGVGALIKPRGRPGKVEGKGK